MAIAERIDPYLGFNFLVTISELAVGAFSEVSGLQVDIEVQDYREGGQNDYIHKFAGPTRYGSNLTLKRGMVDANQLWDWQWEVMHGLVIRKQVSVILLNSAREERRRWEFKDAYPVRWAGPDLKANSSEVAIETLELAHRGLL